VAASLSSSEASRTGERGRGGKKPLRIFLCFLSDGFDVEEGGTTGEYIGVPAPSMVYSSQSISMNECLEADEEAVDKGLSERTDMESGKPAPDTTCGENEEEAS